MDFSLVQSHTCSRLVQTAGLTALQLHPPLADRLGLSCHYPADLKLLQPAQSQLLWVLPLALPRFPHHPLLVDHQLEDPDSTAHYPRVDQS